MSRIWPLGPAAPTGLPFSVRVAPPALPNRNLTSPSASIVRVSWGCKVPWNRYFPFTSALIHTISSAVMPTRTVAFGLGVETGISGVAGGAGLNVLAGGSLRLRGRGNRRVGGG